MDTTSKMDAKAAVWCCFFGRSHMEQEDGGTPQISGMRRLRALTRRFVMRAAARLRQPPPRASRRLHATQSLSSAPTLRPGR